MKTTSAWLRRVLSPVPVLVCVDTLVLVLAFYLAVWAGVGLGLDWTRASTIGSTAPQALTFAICVIAGLLSMGLYRGRQRPTVEEVIVRVMLGAAIGGVSNILLHYLFPGLAFGRGIMFLGLGIACLLLASTRIGILRILDASPIKRRVLAIGAGETAEKLRPRRRADRRRFEVVAFVAMSDRERQWAAETGAVGVISIEEARLLRRFDEIVVALDDRRGSLPIEFLLAHKKRGVPVSDIVDFLERETERLDLDILRPSWLLYESSSETDLIYRWLKRGFDVVFGSVLLLATSPILIITAAAIRIEDGAGARVLYRQRRVGRNARVFKLLKFRSMRADAEKDTGPRFASANDDRITRTGRLIRRFRIDELPQLLNVIRGDMSVVGPRPERPEFVAILSQQVPLYFYRHSVRPGLTGWAQLNFPYGASIDDAREKLTYDLYYIKNSNLVTDLLILLQTLEVVVWGRGTSMSGREPVRPSQQPLAPIEPDGLPAADPLAPEGIKPPTRRGSPG